jgi:hypothetical protein
VVMTGRKLILFVVLAWIVVAGVLVVAFLVTSGDVDPVVRHDLGPIAETAKKIYPATEELALDWRPDAVLAGVTAGWRDAALETLRQPPAWSFQYYSPDRQETFLVAVVGGEPQGLREMLVPYPLPAIPIDQWSVDSQQAVEMWLDSGGARFLERHPTDAELRLQLRLEETSKGGTSRLLWTVMGIVFETNQVETLQIDATTGGLVR